jgi:hypothetical protein
VELEIFEDGSVGDREGFKMSINLGLTAFGENE